MIPPPITRKSGWFIPKDGAEGLHGFFPTAGSAPESAVGIRRESITNFSEDELGF
jgi:hypothetical protein